MTQVPENVFVIESYSDKFKELPSDMQDHLMDVAFVKRQDGYFHIEEGAKDGGFTAYFENDEIKEDPRLHKIWRTIRPSLDYEDLWIRIE